MRILYHNPIPTTVYAGRTIFYGYKNAIQDLGHDFFSFENNYDLEKVLTDFDPDIFITSMNFMYRRNLDLKVLKKFRNKKLKVFANTPFWRTIFNPLRINEDKGLSDNKELINLVRSDDYADFYFNVCEPEDPRMDGFEKATGRMHITIPLAADVLGLKPKVDARFKADISFIGTNLPDKRSFFSNYVFPLKKEYDLKLHGQDWTLSDRLMGWIQRAGQYSGFSLLSNIRKPSLNSVEEASVYFNTKISINVHEEYQRKYGGDCNERTFRIPVSGGFEITDRVACITKYFKEGEEMILADTTDWFDKIRYYMERPEERQKIIQAGRSRVLKEHTYHHRVTKFIDIFNSSR